MRVIKKIDVLELYIIATLVVVFLLLPLLLWNAGIITLNLYLNFIFSVIFYVVLSFFFSKRVDLDRLKPTYRTANSAVRFIILSWLLLYLAYELYQMIGSYFAMDYRSKDQVWVEKYSDQLSEGTGAHGILRKISSGVFFCSIFYIASIKDDSLKVLWFFILMILIVGQFFIGLHRSPVIFLLLTGFFLNHLYFSKKKFPVVRFFVITLLAVPLYLSWQAYSRSDITGTLSIMHGLSGLATALEVQIVVDMIDDGLLKVDYGRQLIYNMLVLVPRFIWLGKPVVSFSDRTTEDVYGVVGEDIWVHTFTILGEGYRQLYYTGMHVYMLLFFAIVQLSKNIVLRNPFVLPACISVFWVKMPILVRADLFSVFSAFWYLVLICITVIVIKSIFSVLGSGSKK